MATWEDLHYNVTVPVEPINRATLAVRNLNAAFFSSAAAAKPLDMMLRGIGRRGVEVGHFLTRSITFPLVAAGAVAGKMAYDFEKSFVKIDALVGNTGNNLAEMRQQVLDLSSSELTRGPNELADALYFITSSGFEGAEAMTVLTASSRAAAAGLGETKTVANLVTSVLQAYGLAADQAGNVTDTLIQAVAEGKAEPEEFARVMGRVIPIAHILGIEFHEVAAGIAAMTLQGANTDIATTAMRSLLTTFTRALPTTQKALAGLGISIDGLNKAFEEQGLLPTLRALSQEIGKFDKSGGKLSKLVKDAYTEGGKGAIGWEKAQRKLEQTLGKTQTTLLSKIFPNVRALTAFLMLTEGDTDQVSKAFGRTAEAADDMGARTRAALAKRAASPVGRFEFATNKARADAIKLGKDLLPVFTKLAEVASSILGFFSGLPKPLKTGLGVLLAALAILGPLTTIIFRMFQGSSAIFTYLIAKKRKIAEQNAALANSEKTVGTAAMRAGEQAKIANDMIYSSAMRATGAVKVLGETRQQAIARELQALYGTGPLRGRGGQFVKRGQTGDILHAPAGGTQGFKGGSLMFGAQTGVGGRAGMTGPGGEPIYFQKVSDEARKAGRNVGFFRTAVRGSIIGTEALGAAGRIAAVGIATAGRAMLAFASFAWPIAAFIVLEQIIAHWDTIGKKINYAISATLRFLHLPGAAVDPGEDEAKISPQARIEKIRDLAQEYSKLRDQGISTKGALDAIIARHGLDRAKWGLVIGDVLKYQHSLKDAMELERRYGTGQIPEKDWDRIAKITKASREEIQNALKFDPRTSAELKVMAKTAADAFKDAFSRVQDDVLTLFDASTEHMLDNIIVKVRVLEHGVMRAFTLKGDQLTPAERELKALDKLERKQSIMDALAEARKAVRDAGKEIHQESVVGRFIWRYDEMPDKDAVKTAADNYKKAQRDKRRFDLENTAAVERAAGDKAQTEARKQVTARRARERRDFTDRMASLSDQLLKHRITVAVFNKKLAALFVQYGVTISAGTGLIGKAFGLQLKDSLIDLEKVTDKYTSLLGSHIRKIGKAADSTAEKVTAMATATEKAVKRMAASLTGGALSPLGKLGVPFDPAREEMSTRPELRAAIEHTQMLPGPYLRLLPQLGHPTQRQLQAFFNRLPPNVAEQVRRYIEQHEPTQPKPGIGFRGADVTPAPTRPDDRPTGPRGAAGVSPVTITNMNVYDRTSADIAAIQIARRITRR